MKKRSKKLPYVWSYTRKHTIKPRKVFWFFFSKKNILAFPSPPSLLHLFHTTFNIFRVGMKDEDCGLPAPVIHCDNARMLRDRVVALRNANIYEKPLYRHCLSGLEWQQESADSFAAQTSYVVINTSQEGVSTIFQAGRYLDKILRTPEGLRFKSKRCIYVTLRVQTLLAFPI